MPLTVLAATANGARMEHPEQDRMAALSDDSRLIDVDTGHYIHWDDPEVVISEVLRMVRRLRANQT